MITLSKYSKPWASVRILILLALSTLLGGSLSAAGAVPAMIWLRSVGLMEPSYLPGDVPSASPLALTSDGCCSRPFWSANSREVLYIDKPTPDAPAGIYGKDITNPGAPPKLITARIASYTPDMSLLVELDGNATYIERAADGKRWEVPAGGKYIHISPNQGKIAWIDARSFFPPETRMASVWVANLDGSNPHSVVTIPRGTISSWLSEDELLVEGRESLRSKEQSLYVLHVGTGQLRLLARAEQLRNVLPSPDRTWVAFMVAPNPDPNINGLWIMRTDGSVRLRVRPDLFGGFKWRDAQRLLIVPFRPDVTRFELWEFDVLTQNLRQLTDPQTTPLLIADGDWSVSPDGRKIAYVSAMDNNIWVMNLPE